MTDSQILKEILARLTTVEDGQHKIEDGQRKLEDGQRKLEDGQRKLEDGQRKLEDGQRKLEDGQRKLEDGQHKLEDGQHKLEDGQHKLERKVDGQQKWFETLNQKIDRLDEVVTGMRGEMGEVRDLMAHLRDDDVVNRRAIAAVSNSVEALEERVSRVEQRPR